MIGLDRRVLPQTMAGLMSSKKYNISFERLETDGYLGVPVELYTMSNEGTKYTDGVSGSPIILYVINTNTERIGTDSDEAIVSELLQRGFLVVVADYLNAEAAVAQGLCWSLQRIRGAIIQGKYTDGLISHAPLTYIVPSGYNITYDYKFFSFDEYGCTGDLERIVEIWNNDFVSTKGDKKITIHGEETTVRAYTARFTPENPMTIYDCIKPDGTMVDLDLRLDIIYPTNPVRDVPVMTLMSSTYERIKTWTEPDRPQLTAFLFGGYAAVVSDHPLVPMCRDDHYGYFTGNPMQNSVSGDNQTYSLSVYSGIKADTALIRTLRALGDPSDPVRKYAFDVNAIGVFGNSKAGTNTRLSLPCPEKANETRLYEGHCGESRYELKNNPEYACISYPDYDETYKKNGGIIRPGKAQPCLTYKDGTSIPGKANFVYAQCGGAQNLITNGCSPIFGTGTMVRGGDGPSYYVFYREMRTHCRTSDVPFLGLLCEKLGHTFGYGPDRDHPEIDVFDTFKIYADYWLKGDSARCLYIDVDHDAHYVRRITVQFTGPVSREEIEKKVKIEKKVNKGTKAPMLGSWMPSFGGLTWTLRPHGLKSGTSYCITVPESLFAANGKRLYMSVSKEFTIPDGKDTDLRLTMQSLDKLYYVLSFSGIKYSPTERATLCFSVENQAYNTVIVCASTNGKSDTIDKRLGEIQVIGAGDYSLDVTDYVRSCTDSAAFTLFLAKAPENKALPTPIPQVSNLYGYRKLEQPIYGHEGKTLAIDYQVRCSDWIDINNDLNGNYILSLSDTVSIAIIDKPISAADYGRTFLITVPIFDTTSRILYMRLHPADYGDTVDTEGFNLSVHTKPNKWETFTVQFSIDDPMDWEVLQKRFFVIAVECKSLIIADDYAAIAPSNFAKGSGYKGKPVFVGEKGLNSKYTVYPDAVTAEKAGKITVCKQLSKPIYFGEITIDEVFTDVKISKKTTSTGSAPTLVVHQ